MLVKDGFKFISPPSIEPLVIAQRHLGPMTPRTVGTVDKGTGYEIRDGLGVKLLHYDMSGDPLGLLDVVVQDPQLYDRARDPEELNNLYARQPKRAELMAATLKEMYEASLALYEELDDGERAEMDDPHLKQQLAALGYVAGHSETLNELPLSLRKPFTSPCTPPDTTLLTLADRRTHMVRLAVAEGTATDNTDKILRKIANTYTHWAARNPEHIARVGWRITALMDIGREAEIAMDPVWWATLKRRFAQQLILKEAREAEAATAKEAAAEAAGQAAPQSADEQAGAGLSAPDETDTPPR
jgi:hypothetical protein